MNKNSDKVYICESPIDALSLMTLNKDFNCTHNYLSLNGVSTNALENFLEKNKNIKNLITALDRDEAGMKATKKIWNTYKDSYKMGNYFLFVKDVNEQLINMKKDIQVVVTDCDVSDPFNKGEITELKYFKERMEDINVETYVKVDVYKGKISLMEDIVCFQDENQNFDLYKTIDGKKQDLDKAIQEHLKMINEIQLEHKDEATTKDIKEMKALISRYKYGSDILMENLREELGIDITKDKRIETGIINSIKNIEKNLKNQVKEQSNSFSKEVER